MSAVFQAVFQAKPGDDSQRRFLVQHSVVACVQTSPISFVARGKGTSA